MHSTYWGCRRRVDLFRLETAHCVCVASRSAALAKPVAREASDVVQPEEETGHEEGNCFALGGIGDDLVCACAFRRHRQERLSRRLEAVSLPLKIG